VVHQAEREDAMKQVIVSRNNNEEVWVQTPTGKILAECFFGIVNLLRKSPING
jgi:hypothetical protein